MENVNGLLENKLYVLFFFFRSLILVCIYFLCLEKYFFYIYRRDI